MTAKEALENIKDILDDYFEGINPTEKLVAYCYVKDIETALNRLEELEKVLKIIKEKDVNIVLFKDAIRYFNDELDYYNANVMDNHRKLTETEFNLLKEYLK